MSEESIQFLTSVLFLLVFLGVALYLIQSNKKRAGEIALLDGGKSATPKSEFVKFSAKLDGPGGSEFKLWIGKRSVIMDFPGSSTSDLPVISLV